MKFIMIVLLTLASCSTTLPTLREPAAVSSDSLCSSGVKSFFGNEETSMTKNDLLKRDLISQRDLKFLDGSLISKTFPDNSSEREQMEISYLLIKKQHPDFQEEQVIDHYQLLKIYCGI